VGERWLNGIARLPRGHTRAKPLRRRIAIVGIIAHAPVDVVADAPESLLAAFGLVRHDCTTIALPDTEALDALVRSGPRPPRLMPGGCGANVAAGLRRLGTEAAIVAPFGNDAHADLARADLTARGVEIVGFNYDGPHQRIYVLITADGERTFADYCHGVPYDLTGSARGLTGERIVAMDGYLLLRLGVAAGVRAYLDTVRPASQSIVFCPGGVSVFRDAPDIAGFALDRCSHVVMSHNESAFLYPGLSDEDAVAALRARGLSGAVTRGELGAILFDAEGTLQVGPPAPRRTFGQHQRRGRRLHRRLYARARPRPAARRNRADRHCLRGGNPGDRRRPARAGGARNVGIPYNRRRWLSAVYHLKPAFPGFRPTGTVAAS
jgi:sugar/nucleoside kinase (ribokinase family)